MQNNSNQKCLPTPLKLKKEKENDLSKNFSFKDTYFPSRALQNISPQLV